ncbi:MAG: hypothetical protein HUJ51_06535 [Eggerthellaceae bacterium]|nr:hypothetical protein [Eggerthellaceae bacterium]
MYHDNNFQIDCAEDFDLMREKLEFPPVDTIFYNPEHDELRLEDKCLDMSD